MAFGLTLATALALLAGTARAEPPPYDLAYAAPPGCPPEKEVFAEVRANVPDAASGDGARIALTIVQNGDTFTGELVALDRAGREGRRSIQGPTCSDVSQTLAFLAALAIELGGRVEEEAAPSAAPSAPTPTASGPKSAPPRAPAALAAPEGTWKWAGVLAGGVRGGLAPSVRPSAELGVDFGATGGGLLTPALRATLVGALSRISHSAGTAELTLLAGRFEGCPLRFGGRAIGLRPCAGIEWGAVFAHGEVAGGRSVVEPWGGAEAGLRLEAWLSRRFFLELSAAAVVPFFRTRYFFVPERIIYTVPAVTGRAGLGLGFRFQ
jgi:hypothetical protein